MIRANPYTGTVTATEFVENGMTLADKYLHPTNTGSDAQVLTKTATGADWETLPVASATEYGTSKMVVSTTDIGEGSDLDAGTIYAVIGA